MYKSFKIFFFLDFGINGEMVFGSSSFMFVCLIVVGFVFEGVNILCGMGVVEGVIDSVKIENGKVYFIIIGVK